MENMTQKSEVLFTRDEMKKQEIFVRNKEKINKPLFIRQ